MGTHRVPLHQPRSYLLELLPAMLVPAQALTCRACTCRACTSLKLLCAVLVPVPAQAPTCRARTCRACTCSSSYVLRSYLPRLIPACAHTCHARTCSSSYMLAIVHARDRTCSRSYLLKLVLARKWSSWSLVATAAPALVCAVGPHPYAPALIHRAATPRSCSTCSFGYVTCTVLISNLIHHICLPGLFSTCIVGYHCLKNNKMVSFYKYHTYCT